MLLTTVVVAAPGHSALRSLSVDALVTGVERAAAIERARDVRDNTSLIASAIRDVLLADMGEDYAEERKRIDALRTADVALLDKTTQAETSAEARELIGQAVEARKAFAVSSGQVVEAEMTGAVNLANGYMKTELRGTQTVYFAAIEK